MTFIFWEQLYFIALVYPVKIIMNKFVRNTTIYEYYCKKAVGVNCIKSDYSFRNQLDFHGIVNLIA